MTNWSKGYLTARQAAKRLDIDQKTLREKYIKTGLLPVVHKNARRYFISEEDYAEFCSKYTVQPRQKKYWELQLGR